MYNVVNSILTDRKMYRFFFEVSFYFRGSLYEMNALLTLFLQIEVSIKMLSFVSPNQAVSMLTKTILFIQYVKIFQKQSIPYSFNIRWVN